MNGYAKSSEISFGTYTVVETKFPPNYQAGDKNSWSVTLDSNHVTVVLDVANERQSGNLKVLKKSEDGKRRLKWNTSLMNGQDWQKRAV